MTPVPPLDHAAYGNGRVLGLVAPTASIDWLCLPRFDSPSVLARLLDDREGGSFRVLIGGEEVRGSQAYIRNTNVVRTFFDHNGDSFDVIDYAPRLPEGLTTRVPYEIVRMIRPHSGHPRIALDLDVRPDYAREHADWLPTTDGLERRTGSVPLQVATNIPPAYLLNRQEFALTEPVFVSLHYGPRRVIPTLSSVQHDLNLTIEGWRRASKACYLPGFADDAVLRSALCLKLHTYHDTGAIIAAATTSIPEAMGTERTWDYRYCWLRDAAFVAGALRRVSFLEEGELFISYLRDVVESGELQPLYGIGGERDLREVMLPHLAGFGGNGHVRIGNAASTQPQHDLMGEVLLCLDSLLSDPRIVHRDPSSYFPLVRRMVELAIERGPTPDTGIWEYRTMLRHHTFSRAMCWAAIHRGAAIARRLGFANYADRWSKAADAEREVVLSRGYNDELGFFTQELDGANLDASNLLLATIGLVPAQDPRFIKTVDASLERLTREGLTFRYLHADDLGVPTTAFSICSFWHAEALAMAGRLPEAIAMFERMLAYANPVGLFSEDVDPSTGGLIGNFPQAYTHVGLINAAVTIGEILKDRDGRVGTWA
ncbi:MAG: glycoside hydrolase family 15 protein [Gemmatimonadales bacterium]